MYRSTDRFPGEDAGNAPHVSAAMLADGGALMLLTLRVWIEAFSAGRCPPVCAAAAFARLGCPSVPGHLLRALRLLRGSRAAPLYFNATGQAALTRAERLLLDVTAAAICDLTGAERLARRLAGPELARSVSACLAASGRELDAAGLAIWSGPAPIPSRWTAAHGVDTGAPMVEPQTRGRC